MFLELPWRIFWWIFWRIFLTNFFDKFFDVFFMMTNFLWIFWQIFWQILSQFFWQIFWPIIFYPWRTLGLEYLWSCSFLYASITCLETFVCLFSLNLTSFLLLLFWIEILMLSVSIFNHPTFVYLVIEWSLVLTISIWNTLH